MSGCGGQQTRQNDCTPASRHSVSHGYSPCATGGISTIPPLPVCLAPGHFGDWWCVSYAGVVASGNRNLLHHQSAMQLLNPQTASSFRRSLAPCACIAARQRSALGNGGQPRMAFRYAACCLPLRKSQVFAAQLTKSFPKALLLAFCGKGHGSDSHGSLVDA